MKFFYLDDKSWPICTMVFQGKPTDENFDSYLEEFGRHLGRPGKRVYLMDLSRASATSSKQRRKQAQFFKDYETLLGDRCLGNAIVTDSAIIRGIITAVNWIYPPPHPHKICKTHEEGLGICFEWLRANNITPPNLPVDAVQRTSSLNTP